MIQELHIGQMIKAELRRQGRQIKWFAEELQCNRSNVYGIFKRDNIDVKKLIKISRILDHNFLTDINDYNTEIQ